MSVALALSLLMAEQAAVLEPPSKTQCEVALQVAKSIAINEKGKVAFQTVDADYIFRGLSPFALNDRWVGVASKVVSFTAPPSELSARFVHSGMRNAVSRCAAVRTWLRDKKIKFGKRSVERVFNRMNENERLPVGVFTIGLPLIGADGRTALRYVESTFGSDASEGHIEYLIRDVHGQWTHIANHELFIS